MLNTTLGYIEKDGCWLMMHRTKKKDDVNEGKWIGIGGKVEDGETPLEGMKRECMEETGLRWNDPTLKGIITFNFKKHLDDPLFSEIMFLFTGSDFEGNIKECREGELAWVEKSRVEELHLWSGDLIFLNLMEREKDVFFLQLDYLQDSLVGAWLNGDSLFFD